MATIAHRGVPNPWLQSSWQALSPVKVGNRSIQSRLCACRETILTFYMFILCHYFVPPSLMWLPLSSPRSPFSRFLSLMTVDHQLGLTSSLVISLPSHKHAPICALKTQRDPKKKLASSNPMPSRAIKERAPLHVLSIHG